jgi:cellulose synthase (UDP-forming)
MAAAVLSQTAREAPPQAAVEPLTSANLRREIFYTRLIIAISVVTSTVSLSILGHTVLERLKGYHLQLAAIDAFFAVNIAFLIYGSLFHQFTRLAYLVRLKAHRRASRDELESIYTSETPHPLTILLPSYCEETRVVRMALMSAALTEYPDRNVVLLIDNPPNPVDSAAAKELIVTRELVRRLDRTFRSLERRYAAEYTGFERRRSAAAINLAVECAQIARLYREIATWMEKQAAAHELIDHYDETFVQRVLLEPAAMHRERAAEIEKLGASSPVGATTLLRIAREYRRIASFFAVQVSSFERKRFVNLSHASNKAMNINSYLGLIGRNFREVIGPGGRYLEECDGQRADLRIRSADYIITLDADSMLLNDYAMRLTHIMDQPKAAKYAVVESPYSAVPGASSVLERIAGAQTDVQWYGSQGSTRFNGSFWVGANALLRRSALEDIREIVYERGFPISRYIHDHTLVEDTESTIDLVVRGWKVYCYPERLSYSATPRDFGALVIQRRRWANGPVLIIPKLLRYAFSVPGRIRRIPETILRLYTLSSAAGALSMLVVTCARFPDAKRLPMAWLMLSAAPYYFLYCRDLQAAGYQWWDLPRVYAMNLLLIPVNLAGLLRSLYQAITGRRPVFARTPKVPGRTAAPAVHTVLPLAILFCVMTATLQIMMRGGWAYGAYGILNCVSIGYAILIYIGIRAGVEDLGASVAFRTGVFKDYFRGRRETADAPEAGAVARRRNQQSVTAEISH